MLKMPKSTSGALSFLNSTSPQSQRAAIYHEDGSVSFLNLKILHLIQRQKNQTADVNAIIMQMYSCMQRAHILGIQLFVYDTTSVMKLLCLHTHD